MNPGQTIRGAIAWLVLFAGSIGSGFAEERGGEAKTNSKKESVGQFINDLLPTAWQKRPLLHYTVITEMTPEGRKRRVPTPDAPMTYFCSPGKFVQTGWAVEAGEKPPPAAQLEAVMRQALAGNGYVPTKDDKQRPDVLIIFTFGSSGTDPAALARNDELDSLPVTADELVAFAVRDPTLVEDIVGRARFVGGDRFASELKTALNDEVSNMAFTRSAARAGGAVPIAFPVSPDADSPFNLFMNRNDATARLAELAFHTCYFVVATAYDFHGVENRKKVPLWQTRMAVDAQGVALDEVLRPLIMGAGAYLGRETTGAVIIEKRLDREGRVNVGTPTVVEDAKPDAATVKSKP